MLKKKLIVTLWCLLAIVIAGLLIAAAQKKKELYCTDIKVEIESNYGHVFVDESDIVAKLKANGAYTGRQISEMNLRTLETIIKKQPWIQNAELYFDNNEVLEVKVKEREPIARVFTSEGASFYIDSSGMRLPLSSDYSAHVPVFTSFSSNKKKLSKPDSLLLNNIKKMALFIQHDSFWNAQVSQVVITPQSTFNIVPVVGNQTIILGSADSLPSKFEKLYAFYQQVWVKSGFEKYETIDASFTGQIVATKRNEPKPYIDSVLAQRIVTAMRSGVDILKDSSYLFHGIDATQKTSADTSLATIKQPEPTPADTGKSVIKKTMKPTIKIGLKKEPSSLQKQPKAMMPKSKTHG